MYHRLKKIIKLGLILIWSTAPALAWALASDKYQPLQINSHTATYDREQHIITYEGEVSAEQGSSHLDGDKVLVYQAGDNQIKEVVTLGKPAHYNTLPEAEKPRLYVEALKITYDPNLKTVLLEGEGKVTQEGNVFTGPHIWYDMTKGIVRSQPTKANERTVVIIQPQKPAPSP